MQARVGELVGQQAEARDVARPAPARRLEGQHGDLERIAGLGAIDEDRTGHRIDERKVELGDVGRGRGPRELPR